MSTLVLLKLTLVAAAAIFNFAPSTYPPTVMEWGACVAVSSARHRVPVDLLVSVIQHESQWDPEATSHTHDFGLGQMHCPSKWCRKAEPDEAERGRLLDPCTNIDMTAEFLRTRGLKAYNPGSPQHAQSVLALARKVWLPDWSVE
jgi:soluble lytic murein transglycosylase-like protein